MYHVLFVVVKLNNIMNVSPPSPLVISPYTNTILDVYKVSDYIKNPCIGWTVHHVLTRIETLSYMDWYMVSWCQLSH